MTVLKTTVTISLFGIYFSRIAFYFKSQYTLGNIRHEMRGLRREVMPRVGDCVMTIHLLIFIQPSESKLCIYKRQLSLTFHLIGLNNPIIIISNIS